MIIAHISDTHIALPDKTGRLANLDMAVDEINQLEQPVDLVVHGGDIAHWATEAEYLAALNTMNKLNAPFVVIPGNRDRRTAMSKAFENHLGNSTGAPFFQYALEGFPTRIVMLDTLNEKDRLGTMCDARIAQMDTLLAKEPQKPTVIFMHHPPFDVTTSPHPFQFDSRKTVGKIAAVLSRHVQVKAIYCGHVHRPGSGTVDNIPAITIPSIAIDLRWGDYPESHASRPAFEIYSL